MMINNERTVYVGIDVALRENVIALIDDKGKMVLESFRIANNQIGVEELETKLEEICQNQKFSKLLIGTEATSFYDFHLVDFLAESERLSRFKAEIYRFNPKIVKKFKGSLKEMDKTDLVDALVIAERLRFGRLPCPYHSLKEYFPVQRLTRYRFHLIENIVKEKGYLLSHLFLKYSSFSSRKPIKRVLGATARAVITEFLSPEEIVRSSLEDLSRLIIGASKNRFPYPKKMARLIQ